MKPPLSPFPHIVPKNERITLFLWFYLFIFKYKFIYFNWRLITILYWFCHASAWIRHRCTCVPHPEPPSHLPSHTIHLWVIPVHQPQASCIMRRTWTGDSFHIGYYTCFNAILPNHLLLALSHRVQKTVLDICVSFLCLTSCFQIN